MKLTITRSKNAVCFYVQKSIRKAGKTTSITVEKLGNIEQVRARAGGKDPYQWAREYVDELNRREYEQNKEIIARFCPSKLLKMDEQKTFNCGYLFLQKIYYSLGLDKICKDISSRYMFEYDLNDILSGLIYTRILYPSSKLASSKLASNLLEQPSYELHDVYRSLSVLAEENDYIQSQLYKNSQKVIGRKSDVLYYDCTNYYFELEEADGLRRYGKSKQHQPLPIVGMGMFMDYDGIPLAFDIYPGNRNEQPTLKPLEKKVIKDFGIDQLVVCTDAGLSSKANRRFNNKEMGGVQIRSFITTQSIKQMPKPLKDYSLDHGGWRMLGSDEIFDLDDIDEEVCYDKVFYKDRWIKEAISEKEEKNGTKPLEQHLIVSYSPKYKAYLRHVRQGQIDRAQALIDSGKYKERPKNQHDPHRFIKRQPATKDGEICSQELVSLDEDAIAQESIYDGFYAVCTNLDDMDIDQIIRINKKRWEIEECFRIMKTDFKARPVYLQTEDHIKAHFLTCFIALIIYRLLEKKLDERYTCSEIISTLRNLQMFRLGDKMGYAPAYTRTELTDALHETAGFRTDYQILTDISMKKVLRESKGKK